VQDLTLRDSSGRSYRPLLGAANPDEDGQPHVQYFDGDAAPLAADDAPRTFRVTGAQLALAQPSAVTPAGGDAGQKVDTSQKIAGPWTFEFTVPVLSDKAIRPKQTVTNDGIALQLERVVVTPSAARAYLRLPAGRQQFPIGDLLIPDGHGGVEVVQTQATWLTDNGGVVLTFPTALDEHHGSWTLAIRAIADPEVNQPALPGSWRFEFALP